MQEPLILLVMCLKLKPLRFLNWSQRWYDERKIESEKGLISPSYLKTLRVYLYAFQNFFQDIDIRDIGTKNVRGFYLSLNGSPKYIFNIMSCLHKMLHDAFDNEETGKIPKFPKIEVPEPDIKIIDLDIQDQIIARIPDQMDRTYILTTARLMLRPSETRALWWEDWDFKHDRVTIHRHFSLNQLRVATKSKRIRIVPIDSETKEAVSHLPRHISSPFVFQKNGRPYSEAYARKLWKRITKEMGVDIPLYQGTRHSSATEARERVGLDKVQEFMGHTNSATTKRYAKMNVSGLRSVLREK